jgi:hypothetical protein
MNWVIQHDYTDELTVNDELVLFILFGERDQSELPKQGNGVGFLDKI